MKQSLRSLTSTAAGILSAALLVVPTMAAPAVHTATHTGPAVHSAGVPSLPAWQWATPMNSVRRGLSAVTGSDGRIYAIGGCADQNCNNNLNTVEAYDPDKQTWSAVANLGTARGYLGAVL